MISYNTVTPSLRAELEKIGVPVSGADNTTVKEITERFNVSEADAAPAVEAINSFKEIQLEMDLAGLMNKSKVQTIFDAFRRDLIYKGGVDFVGRTFKDVNELAVAASVFRDPRFETARYFFLDDNGKVVMNTGVSSQIPNAAAVFAGKGRDEINKFINETFNKASDLGATTVCLLHNHPSGDVTPSSADFSAVRMLENLLSYGPMKLGEAIIIDHGKYTRFRSDGFKQQVVYDFGNADPMVSTGETVLSPEAVKQVAASVNAEENDMVLIFSNTKGKVTGIQKITGDYFKDYDSFRQYVHDEGIKFGSAKTFANVHNAEQSLRTIIGKAYEDNIITDAVMGDYSYADYGLPKKKAGDGEYAGQEHVGEVRFSLKDSEGRNLTKAQQEYFKDSKVLDEDGNLLVVYHGTDADFTVFDRTKGRSTMDIQGSFFSPWDIDAGGYGPNVKGEFTDYKYLHAKNLGRFTLTADPSATQIDKAWAEMQEIFGKEWFPEDITTVPEMITHISGLLDDMEPIYENPYSYDMAEVIEYEANAIIDVLISEHVRQTAPTYADKMQRKVDIARFHEAEALRRVREQRDAKIAALKEHYKRAAADKRARRDDSEARTRLLKIAKRLNNRKMTAVNRARLNEYIGDLDLISKGITGKSIEKLSALREWYDDKIQNDPDFIRDEHIEKAVARLSKRHISELTQTEVAELTEVLLNIENELRTEKKLIDSQIKHDIAVAGAQIISDVENSRGSDGGVIDEMVVTELLSPEREAKRLTGYNENDPLLTATKELSAGQRKMFDYRRRAESRFTKWVQDKKFVQDIAGKKAREITITGSTNKSPVQVKITPAMRMSLYLHSLNDQNLKHISQGGITIPNMEWYKKGDLQKALDKGVTIRLSPSQVREITSQMTAQERAFAQAAHDYFNGMSRDEINAVSEQLKGYSLASVDNYFPINTDKNFLKKEFDSIKQDGTIEGMGFLKERVNSANPIMLRDMNEVLDNSIKQHSKYIGLAIAVRNFNKLWNATVGGKDQEGKWNSFANSVQGAISKKWGNAAKTYVERMMKDLNNTSSMHEVWGEKMAKVRSNYAKAVLEMNAGVAVKQAASYPTAAAVVGWGPLLKAMKDPTNRKVNLDLVAKYTPLLWYRSQGFSSQELGDIKNQGKSLPKALNWIQAMDVRTTTKLWTAAEYYVRDNTSLQQGSDAYYQQVADVYNRIIEETQPNYTTMQRPQLLRSENELVKTVNMFKTQPFQNFNVIYDAVGEMRAKKAAYTNTGTAEAKAAYDAAKKKAALAISSQAISAVTFALMQFAWDAFRGKDDKYKDEEGDESLLAWLKGMGLNMLSNGFGMLPYGGFMLELAETATDKVLKELDKDPFFDAKFYGLEASPLQTVNDTGEGLIKLVSETAGLVKELSSDGEPNFETYSRTVYQTVEGWAQLIGKPVANVRKDFEALAYQFLKKTKGSLIGRYYSTRITSDPSKYPSDYYDLLYRAKKKDANAYQQIYDLMMSDEAFGGNAAGEVFTDKKIKSAIESRMKKDQCVTKRSDLDQKYLTPDQQKEYDKTLEGLSQSSIWKEATAGQKEKALDALYNIAFGSDSGQKKQEDIKKSGLSETEYLLYMTALDMVDRGTIGSYDKTDNEAAIRLLPISDVKKDKLWSSKYKKAATPNW